MTKITVIDVDIGISVDDVITKNFEQLSKKAQNELEIAVSTQKKVQEKKTKIKTKKQIEEDLMDKIYTRIEESGNTGVAVEELMEMAKGIITTTPAMTTRIKTLLRHRENIFKLSIINKDKKRFYVFENYNSP